MMLKNRKAQLERMMLAMIIIVFGGIGILLWGGGIAFNNLNAVWIGKLFIGLISIIVLIIERFLR